MRREYDKDDTQRRDTTPLSALFTLFRHLKRGVVHAGDTNFGITAQNTPWGPPHCLGTLGIPRDGAEQGGGRDNADVW